MIGKVMLLLIRLMLDSVDLIQFSGRFFRMVIFQSFFQQICGKAGILRTCNKMFKIKGILFLRHLFSPFTL